jgi:hypothetical protein
VPKDSQRFLEVVCKAYFVFMLSPSSRSTAKPAAAWQKNSYKNGIAKVLRQATAQKPPKDSNHKHSPNTQKPSFMLLLLLVCRTCRKGWSLSIFCCILFFITIKI